MTGSNPPIALAAQQQLFEEADLLGPGGDVLLVAPGDARRLSWAVTEFSIQLGDA